MQRPFPRSSGSDPSGRRRARGFVAIVLLASLTPASAQVYDIETFTEGEGLPSSTVRGLAEGPDGRIWFATSAGIGVWDGLEWTIHGEKEGLHYRDRSSVEFDERGIPWSVATPPAADVAWWDEAHGRWVSLPRPPCAGRGGLAVARGASPERLAVGSLCGLMVREDGAWRRIVEGLPSVGITDVVRFDGAYVVATVEGLGVVRDGSTRAETPAFELPPGPVLGLAVDDVSETHGLLVAGVDWVGAVEEGNRFRIITRHRTTPHVMPTAIAPDGSGGIFFGTGPALHHFHPSSGVRLLDKTNGLASAGAEDLLFDREGNVWVAALRGASRIGSFALATYRQEHGLLQTEVTAALERRGGGVVLGHCDGLTLVEDDALRRLPFRGTVPTRYGLGRVLDLAEQSDGTLWIAANERGLGRMVGDEVSWSRQGKVNGVTSVRVDRDDHLWVADGREVLVDRGAGLETVGYFGGDSGIRRLLLGDDGAIYAASLIEGLFRWNGSGWDNWRDDGTKLNSAYAVKELPDGRLAVGTAGGLAEALDGELREMTSPRIDRPVYFILEDSDGRLWFGTDNGVLRWDGRRVERFSVEQGLGGRETNRAAGLLDSRGRVWIGTTGGVTVYRPELDPRTSVPPEASFLGVESGGVPVGSTEPIRVDAADGDLVFKFRAIHLGAGPELWLQRRLEGFDADWSAPYASRDREVRYTNLPAGRYRFHVRAATSPGSWSQVVSSPTVIVAGPLWTRPWFWGVVALFVVAIGYAAYRHVYQVRQTHRLEREVEQRVEQLRRVEAELTRARGLKSLGLLAGGIAHDFNNLLTVVLGNLTVLGQSADSGSREKVADAEAAVHRARELTNQLLTFSKGGEPVRGPSRIEDVIGDSVRFVFSGSNARCEVDLEPDLPVVRIDPGQINQVLNNILINAIQAMPDGGVVRITGREVEGIPELSRPGRYVAVAVRDEGIGIPEHDLERVFDPYFSTKQKGSGLGLTTSYSIVRRHEGLLTVDSRPGRGSTFTVYLPVSDAEIAPPVGRRAPEHFDGIRVLVMDDDEAVRDAVRGMLESLGCVVTTTLDGREAVERYAEASNHNPCFDVVILDLTVPAGMGGEETIRELLRIDPDVRAIVASGYSNAPVIAHARDYGFRAVLTKPFDREDIIDAFREVLPVSGGVEGSTDRA